MTPCLLGPRHGHIVGERPRKYLQLASDTPGVPAVYKYTEFLCDDGRSRFFYIWTLDIKNKDRCERAVDDYLLSKKKGTHGKTWEHQWKKPPDLRDAYLRDGG